VAATSAGNAWAVGQTYTRTGSTASIKHWDGTAWTSPASFCGSPSAAPACLPAGITSQAAATTPARDRPHLTPVEHGPALSVTTDGFREPGCSKERRPEPQITIGLLTG
jgi:hypothetical protein